MAPDPALGPAVSRRSVAVPLDAAVTVALPPFAGPGSQSNEAENPLAEVANRLERIAGVLRSGTPADLLAFGRQVRDPLELLVAGFALGYVEGQRAGG